MAGIVLLDNSHLQVDGAVIITRGAGNGVNPNRGQGGWNHGIFVDNTGSQVTFDSGNNSYQLGAAGNDNAAEPPEDIHIQP